MRWGILIMSSVMNGVLYRNSTAIKRTVYQVMKRNECNPDCKVQVTSHNTLRTCVSNPNYASTIHTMCSQFSPPLPP